MIHAIFTNLIFSILSFSFTNPVQAALSPDVQHYDLKISPDIENASVTGSVAIEFKISSGQRTVTFDKGALEITNISGETLDSYSVERDQLILKLTDEYNTESHRIVIDYRGTPKRGLLFDPSKKQAYTVYFTSEWMVCNNDPSDKASVNMEITLPGNLQCIASGVQNEIVEAGEVKHLRWVQEFESPAYTYGFAVGVFEEQIMQAGSVVIKNYSTEHSIEETRQIFKETPAMIAFFEEKSGVKYAQKTYSQLLMGNHYQEMSGFSVLKSSYGALVLKDSTETNLISHELAHQWWGNRITCQNWNHFWLNEAMATFMSAAYNEHRFGNTKYMADINAYKKVFTDIKERGNDKPLVFKNWLNPSRDDRNIVYFKGAYVLHLLREKMGDRDFWRGIKAYSTKYFDQSVDTEDFHESMQAVTEIDLDNFFKEWVY